MKVLIWYHVNLVYALIIAILLNLLVAYSIKDLFKLIKYTRIGYFLFWAVWAMAVFAGLIVFAFTKAKITPAVTLMIIVSIILPFIDGYRAIKFRKIWLNGESGREFSIKLLVIELVLIILTFIGVSYI